MVEDAGLEVQAMNKRIEQLRNHVNNLNDEGVRKTLFYSLAYESLKTTRAESVQVRRAKAQAHILQHMPLAVHPYELIAGSLTEYFPIEENIPDEQQQIEQASLLLDTYLQNRNTKTEKALDRKKIKTFESDFTTKKSRWALMSRVFYDASISYEQLQKLIGVMAKKYEGILEKYEIGRELERSFKIDYGKEVTGEIDSLPWFAANHLSLNYASIMQTGLLQLQKDLDKKHLHASDEQKEYYAAAITVANAATDFIVRYAQTLEDKALSTNGQRKEELLEMSKICKKLSCEKAETFREGVQMVWLLHIMMSALWGSALSFGRFDQYMSPLYEQDIKEKRISELEAKELLCCMWMKINEPRMRTVQSLTVGGITPQGENAANSLTKLCIDVVKEMKLPYPNVGVRIHPKNPDWLLDAVVDSVCMGCGQPMIMTDEVWISNLKKLGYSEEYANDYYNMGCVEIMIPGKQPNWGVTDPIAFPMMFGRIFKKYKKGEVLLNNFEEFEAAYLAELDDAIQKDKDEAFGKILDMQGKCYDPFASLMIDDCTSVGKDMFQGGSKFGTHWSFYAYGLGTAADTMMAIKKFVYDKKVFGINQMAELLEQNFDGSEEWRKMLDTQTPHYGNDIKEVDDLANNIVSHFNNRVLSFNSPKDINKYVSTLFGYFFHVYHGEITGATANGRKNGEAFSDSMGPSQGKDTEGPSSMLNSILQLDNSEVTGGYALNLKISPSLVKDKAGVNAIKALFKTYIQKHGPQVQVNFVDVKTLKDAKSNPEKHRNLIVRIGGYCEYFVNLDKALQDEIIARTIHEL